MGDLENVGVAQLIVQLQSQEEKLFGCIFNREWAECWNAGSKSGIEQLAVERISMRLSVTQESRTEDIGTWIACRRMTDAL